MTLQEIQTAERVLMGRTYDTKVPNPVHQAMVVIVAEWREERGLEPDPGVGLESPAPERQQILGNFGILIEP